MPHRTDFQHFKRLRVDMGSPHAVGHLNRSTACFYPPGEHAGVSIVYLDVFLISGVLVQGLTGVAQSAGGGGRIALCLRHNQFYTGLTSCMAAVQGLCAQFGAVLLLVVGCHGLE
jgi:hypothetical protein